MWRVWRVTGIGPDECLKPTYGGCLDPWEQEWENGGSDPETMSGGTNSFLGGFDNMRSGRQLGELQEEPWLHYILDQFFTWMGETFG